MNSQAAVQSSSDIAEQVEFYRVDATRKLDPKVRSQFGQFMTPPSVATFMASLFRDCDQEEVLLLDAGAGVGSLTAAFVQEFCGRSKAPRKICSTAYELESNFQEYLNASAEACKTECEKLGKEFSYEILQEDFILVAAKMLNGGLFFDPKDAREFTHAILNPPYKKIRSDSEHRRNLSSIGIETSNLYTAFLALAVKLLRPDGELVAIIPRSFCNGPYFKPFRRLLLKNLSLRRIHVFESREEAFKQDEVLQENIIIHGVKDNRGSTVKISSSTGSDFQDSTIYNADYDQVINPDDNDLVVHVITSEFDCHVVERMKVFTHNLTDFDIEVSTGPVVDFRLRDYILHRPDGTTVPLIYPGHFEKNFIAWPKLKGRKPNAIKDEGSAQKWLIDNGHYTVVRRFSAKEEPRRVVAAIHNPEAVPGKRIGIENHLNVYHRHHQGLSPELSKGLAVYLNSTLIDIYFRQFNGHTQVNASDLRMLPYPSFETLESLADLVTQAAFPTQTEIDEELERRIQTMAKVKSPDPVKIKKRIDEALEILKSLGLPKAQQNERSALTLLALIGLKSSAKWSKAEAPLMGITPIMDFIRDCYGKEYAPNTRETIRRQTMHQFVQAGLAVSNPDQPDRATNSPHWCYQIEEDALEILKTYGRRGWKRSLEEWLRDRETLSNLYASERVMHKTPLKISEADEIQLSPGKHSELIKAVVEEFGPRFCPGGKVIYVGDTGEKWGYFDEEALSKLGVKVDSHGKMPDTVIHYPNKDWLLLIEAVTSHGPMNPKRHSELHALFQTAKPSLVYVTAFPTRNEMARYLSDISWETEVWVADAPTHLIHFDGERFLGPYES